MRYRFWIVSGIVMVAAIGCDHAQPPVPKADEPVGMRGDIGDGRSGSADSLPGGTVLPRSEEPTALIPTEPSPLSDSAQTAIERIQQAFGNGQAPASSGVGTGRADDGAPARP
jgi:hypothetical protein